MSPVEIQNEMHQDPDKRIFLLHTKATLQNTHLLGVMGFLGFRV